MVEGRAGERAIWPLHDRRRSDLECTAAAGVGAHRYRRITGVGSIRGNATESYNGVRTTEISMPSFEESLKKLEVIVDQLEKGDLALEDSLRLFEEGVGLSAACKKELDEAEGKVQVLIKQRDGSLKAEPFLNEKPL